MTQVNAAKEFDFSNQPHDLEWMMVDARLRQSEAARKLAAQTNHVFLRVTGLGVLGRFLKNTVINPLRLAMLRHRTLANLQQLDDRLLADIGIKRTMIPEIVNQVVSRESLSKGAQDHASHPVASQNPIIAGDIELAKSVASVAPTAAANSNKAAHRAA